MHSTSEKFLKTVDCFFDHHYIGEWPR